MRSPSLTRIQAAAVGLALLVGAAVTAPLPATAATAATAAPTRATHTTATHTTSAGHDWLVAADPAAHAVYVVDPATGRRTGSLKGIEFGTHAGTVQLGHGRIAFMDESKPQLEVVSISATGRPSVVASYRILNKDGRWERAGWLAADPSRRYIAVGSDFDGSTKQQVSVIDLAKKRVETARITTSEVKLATTGETGTEEMETFLVGSPLRLVVTAGGRFDSYSVSRILKGDSTPPVTATTALGAYPHGPIISADGRVIGSTLHDGFETVLVTKRGFGRSTSTPYPQVAVQSYRPRMAPDGTTAVGTQAQSAPTSTQPAADIEALLTSSSTRTSRVATLSLGTGVATRAAVAKGFAAAVVTHDGTDTLTLVSRGRDGLFTGTKKSVVLPTLGQTTGTGSQARFLAATNDGSQLFVTRAGTGTVIEIDLVRGVPRVRGAVALPSALADGGYLTTVDSGQAPFDLSGR
ncbi:MULTISPECIES: hypothetical protein [unclassified Frondihabitans]|uniref:hypothetical protein n=1 Tax=unclassified Frondihabitans TaxID=2626248 RepID=UPI000F4F315E|nr:MULTISPECIES: hypothetical protein [unclassified Frondihabitans]RPE77920.1 hypothetical protein EDF37_0589 [Frondihabitans sp. PhB153]RPF08200.1 hypothetical protein EDF39_0590 [Frondihabitans sp. PhB161]